MKKLFDHIEPALSSARELMKNAQADPASTDAPANDLERARRAVRAARAYLELHRPPEHAMYDPRRVLRPLLEASDERRVVEIESVNACPGDVEQVRLCVELVLENAVLEADAILIVELFEEEETPQLSIEFDGPGRFADPLSFDGFASLPLAELETRWTVATRGGRIDRTTAGLSLRLKGVRVVPESVAGLEAPLEALRAAEQRLGRLVKLARANEAESASGGAELAEALAAVEGVLEAIENGGRGPEPANLCALVEEVVDEHRNALKHEGIEVETWCDRNVPPIAMRRDRARAFFENALRYAAAVLPSGGAVNILVDYDARERVAGIVLSLDGLAGPVEADHRVASMRRAVTEAHDGTLAIEAAARNLTFTATLPDPVGRRLDEWIPGWEAFGERSRQVLRLLKSGGPTPPEDCLLEGVLEEELERWLMPRLDMPAVVNLAHELATGNGDLPGSSPERLEKALTQIRKRKPRKELANPAYAAELLWAYRADARSRAALGIDAVDEDTLRRLCVALLAKPPVYVETLRLLAEALRRQLTRE
jgi:hypothetical protein